MASTKTRSTLTTHCVNLINKDNTWRVLLRILKQISYTRSTNTNEHFHKVCTTDCNERCSSFTSYCFSKQCFTCTRRTNYQYSFRNGYSHLSKFTSVF